MIAVTVRFMDWYELFSSIPRGTIQAVLHSLSPHGLALQLREKPIYFRLKRLSRTFNQSQHCLYRHRNPFFGELGQVVKLRKIKCSTVVHHEVSCREIGCLTRQNSQTSPINIARHIKEPKRAKTHTSRYAVNESFIFALLFFANFHRLFVLIRKDCLAT